MIVFLEYINDLIQYSVSFQYMKHAQWAQFLCILFCLCLVSLTGCIDIFSFGSMDPVLKRANPYLEKINCDDASLRSYAASVLNNLSNEEREAILTSMYRHVVEKYRYFSDPENEEVIQSPFETIQRGGGDCEDLSILLISLLENVGIDTYLVLTDTHAYALAYDIDTSVLLGYVESALMQQVEETHGDTIFKNVEKQVVLKSKENWYYGGNGSVLPEYFEYLLLEFKVNATQGINVYIVNSISEFHNLTNGTSFSYMKNCMYEQVKSVDDSCVLYQKQGGIILSNPRWTASKVSLNITLYYKPSFYALFGDENISYYMIDDVSCVVLDPTAGPFGFPGYDADVEGEKIAINPKSLEYIFLN